MSAFRRMAVATVLLLSFGTVADAQMARPVSQAYDQESLLTGRSAYVDHAPRNDAEADQIVMGLRVPNGPRYR